MEAASRFRAAVFSGSRGSRDADSSSESPPDGAVDALRKLKRLLGEENSRGDSSPVTMLSEIDEIESMAFPTEPEKTHLANLKKMAHDAEDVIADLEDMVLRARTRKREDGKAPSRSSLFPSSGEDDGGGEIDWGKMEERMTAIIKKYEGLKKSQKAFKLGKADGKRWWRSEQHRRPPTGSLPRDTTIYGRDGLIENMIDAITEEERDWIILPVVGPAGVGKTALIQHVYALDKVTSRFGLFGWVFVRDDYDVLKLTMAVLESVTRKSGSWSTLDEAQDELRRELTGRTCFLVLDDVWNSRPPFWCRFWEPLADVLSGSVVFVVTRDYSSVEAMPEEIRRRRRPLVIEPLDDDDSSKLFSSLLSLDIQDNGLEAKAREIIGRCCGLPSRLKMAAFHFSCEFGRRYGHGQEGDISDVRRSYRSLPARLRRCIAYCSLFPSSHMFQKDLLVRLWIAQGFIPEMDGKELEETGMEYFQELWNKSFFLYKSDHKEFVTTHNFLQFEEYSRINCSSTTIARLHDLSSSVRHLSYVVDDQFIGGHGVERRSSSKDGAKALRTLLIVYPNEDQKRSELSTLKFDVSSLPKLEYLRALDLGCTDLKEVPVSVLRHSKHLRFLALNETNIRSLPRPICTWLRGLQTLVLNDCSRLEELPQDIRHMTRLRHLEIDNVPPLCMPAGTGELTQLQTLETFNVGRADGFAGIRELKNLRKLKGELRISGLCNVIEPCDCEEADLANKEGIKTLTLACALPLDVICSDQEEFSDDEDDMSCEQSEKSTEEIVGIADSISTSNFVPELHSSSCNHFKLTLEEGFPSPDVASEDNTNTSQIFEKLRPHDNLENLFIDSYDGKILPRWLADGSFKLQSLELENCRNCRRLPALGLLPTLKYLVISRMPVESIGSELCPRSCGDGSCFPQLRVLSFKELYDLHSWTDVAKKDFPKLKTFSCFNCPKLGQMPNFTSLEALEMENCGALRSLPEIPCLNTLSLVVCDGLEKLPNFTELTELTVFYCEALQKLPELPSLEKLWLDDCGNLESIGFLGEELEKKIYSLETCFAINCPRLGFSARKDASVS